MEENQIQMELDEVILLILSQGGLQSIIKSNINEINPFILTFKEKIIDIFGTVNL